MNLTDIFMNKLKIETKVVSIDSIFSETKVNKTQYAPPYQRNYVWDGEKASYFLESILIGTEIPPLIFFRSKGRVEIIDGRQRYETILRFLRGELRLSKAGLKKLDVLNIDKKTFSSLPEELRNDFLDTKLRVIEFSFASHDGITQADEDSVKQEIFKRYNSGITPLKEIEIDKAIYFDDDLNTFFKEKLKEEKFHNQINCLFKYEEKKVDMLLKKIRQLLVIHKIPIKYYSKAKQKITDKYYDLLSACITSDEFDKLFESFQKKLDLLEEVRLTVDSEAFPYNRLISEVLFWAFSILEDNEIVLPEKDSLELAGFSMLIQKNFSAFEMDRSSFANQIVLRYGLVADFIAEVYGINKKLYIETDADFIQKNRELSLSKEDTTTNYKELRINKPEPSTYTIDDICRLMERHRFLVRPPYQREEVINKKKSSEIIESLLLGIKLPPIFIFKSNDGISEVIDGQQRILSILAFLGRQYMNEKGEMVSSNKDGFSLQLKDSILTGLQGRNFAQLEEEQQDKITNFDLWVIEINERNNPDFEPLDLFIRLNNKPYPIKDDTFEMWNSYIDRELIDTIKSSYANNASWFFMRKTGNRMENENNYTVLSYFNYLEINSQEGSEKGPLDIYKVGSRIAFRLRSKGEISKILENSEKKNDFIAAVNDFEFSFLANLKVLLTDEKDDSDKTLSKNLDEMLGVENGKRTQQSFYVLWDFLKGLDIKSINYYRQQIRREVRLLFSAMPLDIAVDDFNARVDRFRAQYENKDRVSVVMARVGDILDIVSIEHVVGKEDEAYDFFVRREFLPAGHAELMFDIPPRKCTYFGCKLKRKGFSKGYILAMTRGGCEQEAKRVSIRVLTMQILSQIKLPLIPLEKQYAFDKLLAYTQTGNQIQSKFFESILERMVDEVWHKDVFLYHGVSLIEQVKHMDDIRMLDQEQREERIGQAYYAITKEKSELFAELAEAIGITRMLDYEKN